MSGIEPRRFHLQRETEDAEAIHGHGGATRIVWDDEGAEDG